MGEAAKTMARRLKYLDALVAIYGQRKKHGGAWKQALVAEALKCEEGVLTAHLHSYSFDAMWGKKEVRHLNSMKLLAHMLLWALHLTPMLSLTANDGMERELQVEQRELRERFEYI